MKQQKAKFDFKTDIPLWVLLLLALISVPRVIVHDLDMMSTDSILYQLMAVIPLAICLGLAILRRNKRPIYDFLVLGLFYGIFLAAVHLALWDVSWGNNPPALGDKLKDVLDPVAEVALFKAAVLHSSIVTGIVLGGIFGLVALAAQKIRLKQQG